ncbi:MAG: hypothetical protein ACRDR6_22725 [Pseudonocardiaceae bacterium]
MAIVTRKASDISGQEGSDEQFAVVVVRQHPNISEPKALDVLMSELDAFKSINDLVMLEIQMPNGTKKEVAMRLVDLNKVAPNMDDIIKSARGTRGRLPGTRVGNGA